MVQGAVHTAQRTLLCDPLWLRAIVLGSLELILAADGIGIGCCFTSTLCFSFWCWAGACCFSDPLSSFASDFLTQETCNFHF